MPYREPGARPAASPRRVPPLIPPPDGAAPIRGRLAALAGVRRTSPLRGRRAVVAATTGAVIAVIGVTVLALRDDRPAPPPLGQREQLAVPPFSPAAPVSILPSPTRSTPSAATPPAPRRPPVVTTTTTRPPRTTAPTTKPPAPALLPGATVGLAAAERPGSRLRHRDFLARVEEIRSEDDRADARFTVRGGLAGRDCVSFESVNFPGHFLRHRDFVLRLDRHDRSPLFAEDATFCPRSAGDGGALVLESVNYPGHFLVAHFRGVRLERVAPGRATAFVVKTPL
ncbi:hypothetical protein Ade02nite_32540 [Paractinoplanes deccanensis]|uniref:Alpha-L-arabinofuranosidase B arabinose-binding domain-containing protein n=1 Tax=Paractinoplanes deccanensis TaxID=113561 RepID=A0ABQ3Y3R7_9ACTN|nr:hypothetical protein Ade02nite_32540 [Actinoplanes deccanensis]